MYTRNEQAGQWQRACAMGRQEMNAWPAKASSPAQVFKICLDYWNFFVPDVYASVTTGLADGSASFAFVGSPPPPGAAAAGRKQLYREVLSRLRLLMITRMAKPEEVRGHTKQCS